MGVNRLGDGVCRGMRAGLMSTASVAVIVMAAVMAPEIAAAQSPAPAQASIEREVQFDIPAQDLNGALIAFARSAGVQVFYEASSVQGRQGGAVSGRLSVAEGLNRLLSGSGYTYHFTGPNTVALDPLPANGAMNLSPVTVQGTAPTPAQAEIDNLPPVYAGGQVARGSKLGILGNRDVMDTPFNTTSYTSDLMENQQARSLADVLENDPSVRFTTSGGHVMENFTIRGFEVMADEVAFNGMYGVAPEGHVPAEFVERVEVLKGPSALLSGVSPSGGVGGSVNLVPKRAGDDPLTRVTVDYASEMQLGTHVDVGRRFGTDNRVGVRVNTVVRDGDTELDGQSKERLLGSLGADYRGEDFRLSLDAYGTREINDGGSPMMVGFASTVTRALAPPDSSTNLFRNTKGEQNSVGAQLRGEYDITRDITAYAAVGGKTSGYEGLITSTHSMNTAPDGTSGTIRVVNQSGNVHTESVEGGLKGRFQTGPVGHELVMSANSVSEQEDRSYTMVNYNNIYNMYHSADIGFTTAPGDPSRFADTSLSSIALADTLSALDERVLLTLGLRRQSIGVKGYTANTGALSSNYRDHAVTPAVGLVVKPFPLPISIYGNYIEGLTQGGRVTDTGAANYGEVFAPYRTKQQEVGVKWDAGRITNTLSAFRITKPTLSSNTTTHVSTQSDQVNQGLEWNVFGELSESVRALGGVTYMRSELKKTASGRYDGNEAFGTPNWLANLGLEWDLPWVSGLTLDGRAVYTGPQYINSANTLKMPDWWRFDLGARYVVNVRNQDVTLRANVYNLFDRDYWVGSFSDGYVTLSAPRTFMLSASVDF